MTAKRLLEYAEAHRNDDWFEAWKNEIENKQIEIAVKCENKQDKRLEREYQDLCELLRLIRLMEHQRLVLFYKGKM